MQLNIHDKNCFLCQYVNTLISVHFSSANKAYYFNTLCRAKIKGVAQEEVANILDSINSNYSFITSSDLIDLINKIFCLLSLSLICPIYNNGARHRIF